MLYTCRFYFKIVAISNILTYKIYLIYKLFVTERDSFCVHIKSACLLSYIKNISHHINYQIDYFIYKNLSHIKF